MTQREKIYKTIEELEKSKAKKQEQRKKLIEQLEALDMDIYEINIALGECEGGLVELDEIDGINY